MSETTQNATATETKATKGKAPKKSANARTTAPNAKHVKAAKPEPGEKPKAPRESREGWGTFALKLPIPEREAFHNAAGPASASRFGRIVLNAFSNEDEDSFRRAIAEARKLRP
jgi:hypothetical protein